MSIMTLNSTSRASISHNLGDTSFPFYLKNGGEDTFVLKPADSNKTQNSSLSTPRDYEPFHLGRKKTEDREIDVFAADKYFNEEPNDSPKTKELPNQQNKKKDPLQMFDIKEKPAITTPSSHSESSWNSRSALLLHNSNNIPRNQQPCRKSNKKSFLASIGCNCSCNDNSSVEIDDDNFLNKSITSKVDNGKATQELENRDMVTSKEDWQCKKLDETRVNLKTDDHFSFPVFNPNKTGNPAIKMELQEAKDNLTRKSLEVFGSSRLENGKNPSILEKKFTMLNWDTISPREEETEIPASSTGMYGSDSDTSSDLFEIESLSKNANPFLTGQESDGNSMSSCITPTTCYAPSEASIEWSVITASAAGFSTMSDAEELRSTTQKMVLNPPKWCRPSILSGCKSHADVRVAGDAFPNARRQQYPSESFTLSTRFNAESKLKGFDKRSRQHSFEAGALSRSHSGRATHLLYIQ